MNICILVMRKLGLEYCSQVVQLLGDELGNREEEG